MILTEKEKLLVTRLLLDQDSQDTFIELFNRKIQELDKVSSLNVTAGISVEALYSGRMEAMRILKEFAEDLLRIIPQKQPEKKEFKGRI